eukprot:scaffold7402_cov296-Prasinococcus_capsulatus_cf.AAC.2
MGLRLFGLPFSPPRPPVTRPPGAGPPQARGGGALEGAPGAPKRPNLGRSEPLLGPARAARGFRGRPRLWGAAGA